VCLELVEVSLRGLLNDNLSLSLLDQALLDLHIYTMGSLEEKISILEIYNQLIDRGKKHDASDFSCKSGSICLLDERIDFFTDLLFLISLTLVSKILIVDLLERNRWNHRWKARESIWIQDEGRRSWLWLRGTLVMTWSLILVVSNSGAALGWSRTSLYKGLFLIK
jgi:hypothetical protein